MKIIILNFAFLIENDQGSKKRKRVAVENSRKFVAGPTIAIGGDASVLSAVLVDSTCVRVVCGLVDLPTFARVCTIPFLEGTFSFFFLKQKKTRQLFHLLKSK